MNKKILWSVIASIVVVMVGLVFLFVNQSKENKAVSPMLGIENILNSYLNIQDGPNKKKIQLANGHYDFEFEYACLKGCSRIREEDKALFSLDMSPKVEYGDINGDGLADAITTYARGSGGNKPSYGIAVFLNERGTPKNIFTREFTWLDSVSIEKTRKIRVDYRTIYNGAAGYSGNETAYFIFNGNSIVREEALGYKITDFSLETQNKQGWKSYKGVVPSFEFRYPNYFDDPFVTRDAELNKGDHLITLVFSAKVHEDSASPYRYGRVGVAVQKEFSLNKELSENGKVLRVQKYDNTRGECYDEFSDGKKIYDGNLIIGGKHVCIVSDEKNLKEYALRSDDGKYMLMVSVVTYEPAPGEVNEFTPVVPIMIEGIISSLKFN